MTTQGTFGLSLANYQMLDLSNLQNIINHAKSNAPNAEAYPTAGHGSQPNFAPSNRDPRNSPMQRLPPPPNAFHSSPMDTSPLLGMQSSGMPLQYPGTPYQPPHQSQQQQFAPQSAGLVRTVAPSEKDSSNSNHMHPANFSTPISSVTFHPNRSMNVPKSNNVLMKSSIPAKSNNVLMKSSIPAKSNNVLMKSSIPAKSNNVLIKPSVPAPKSNIVPNEACAVSTHLSESVVGDEEERKAGKLSMPYC
jgi:hypothetical protein